MLNNKSLPHATSFAQLGDDCRTRLTMQHFIILIILSWLQCSTAQLTAHWRQPDKFMQQQQQQQQELLQLLHRIQRERSYETLVIYGPSPCVFHDLLRQLDMPTVLLPKGSTDYDWNFGSELLLLSCGSHYEQEQNQRSLVALQHMRRLVYLEQGVQPDQLCDLYFARELHNVAMWSAQGQLYSCRCFQAENYVQLPLEQVEAETIYVQQYSNMKGAIIRTEADQLAPRSMLYHDKSGKVQMIGYVANLVNTFAQRVNATLKLRDGYEIGKTIYHTDIKNRTQNDELDFGSILTNNKGAYNLDYVTYPYTITSYCFMVPLPTPLDFKVIFTMIVDPLVLGILFIVFAFFTFLLLYTQSSYWRQWRIVDVILNDRSLRGLLGQSFPLSNNPSRHLKLVCILLCFSSLMTTTMYGTYIQSYFTHPPTEESLHSFEDIGKSRYYIAVDRGEKETLWSSYNNTGQLVINKLLLTDDWHKFVSMRDSFNASFIYPVMELRWATYAEQQTLFKEPVFYYSNDICLERLTYLWVPIRRYLPYRHLLEEHILNIQEFGLLQYWLTRSFFNMVTLGLTPLEDLSVPKDNAPDVVIDDLSWVFLFYIYANLLACIVFAVECYWGKCRRSNR